MEDHDENIFKKKPWARYMLEACQKITKEQVLKWCCLASEIGENHIDLEGYIKTFTGEVESVYKELNSDLQDIRSKFLVKIEEDLQKVQNYCHELKVPMPTMTVEHLTAAELQFLFSEKLKELESQVTIRKDELARLKRQEMKFCRSLGANPRIISDSPLPTEREIDSFKAYIDQLETLKMEREETHFRLKEEILDIAQSLKFKPKLEYEKQLLLQSNDDDVKVTDKDMSDLESFHRRLEKLSRDTKAEISEIRVKIDEIWNKLDVNIAERDSFRQRFPGDSLPTLEGLREELRNLEELKKANIKNFIDAQRKDLVRLWAKCHCLESQKDDFGFFTSEVFNEDLFELHEMEINKWKSYYEANRKMFEALDKHKRYWSDKVNMEDGQGGADRFKNRGGHLLKEERRRNKILKQLPKLEEALIQLSEEFFMENLKEFRTFGETIKDYLGRLHAEHEAKMKLKVSAKKQERERTPVAGSSRMNLFTTTSALTSRLGTPRSVTIKKVAPIPKKPAPSTALPRVNVGKTRRLSQKRDKRRQRLSYSNASTDKENSSKLDYHHFEETITSKPSAWRSTRVLGDLPEVCVSPATPLRGDTFVLPKPLSARNRNVE